jgi:alpha-1,3-rhamnosyl/mannosyltransferase
LVATIHDVGFLSAPDIYASSDRRRQKRALHRALRRADVLLAVSHFTKKELVERCSVRPDRVVVTPLAASPRFAAATPEKVERMRVKYRLSRHYFLCVSRVDKKKNLETLIRAFEIFKSRRGFGDPHELVVVGPDGFGSAGIRARAAASPSASAIHLLSAVAESEKIALYHGSLGYVNLSWYEGFGLTPLEATAAGVPCLLSDIPAHREVMGDGALYVSPVNPELAAAALKHFAEEPSRREEFVLRATEHAKEYSWEKTAALTWEALRGAGTSKNLFHVG